MAKYDENSSRFKEMAKMVGAFVSAVRETGKAPVVSVLYKQTLNRSCAPETARKFKAVMASVVAAIYNDGSAKLYRENRTSKELVPIVLDTWKTIKVPSARKYTKHEKPAVSPACFTEDLFRVETPKQEKTPIVSEPSKGLGDYSTEELSAELIRRGWTLTLSKS